MTGSCDHFEPPDAGPERTDDLARRIDGRDRVQLADTDERRTLDAGQLIQDVEPAEQLHAMWAELGVPRPARQLLCVRDMRTEGGEDPRPLLVRDRVAAVVAPGKRRNVVAGDAPEPSTKRSRSKRAQVDWSTRAPA